MKVRARAEDKDAFRPVHLSSARAHLQIINVKEDAARRQHLTEALEHPGVVEPAPLPRVLGEEALPEMPNLKRLVDEITARPAGDRAVALAAKHKFKTEMDETALRAMFPSNYAKTA